MVDTVQEAMPLIIDTLLLHEAEKIVHEEVAHYRVHDTYNEYLRRSGVRIDKYVDITMRLKNFIHRRFSLLTRLAICSSTEHFTATMSRQILDSGILEGKDVDERMDIVWSWHALEELDHRNTVFDIYLALGGGYFRRVYAMLISTVLFLYIHHVCMFSLLRQRKILFSSRAWKSGIPHLFGKQGIYRALAWNWLLFFKPSFHPIQIPIENKLKKQLHHYHIESQLIKYFLDQPSAVPSSNY